MSSELGDEEQLERNRKAILDELGLPYDSRASDVIQRAVNATGHHVSLFDLMVFAGLFDGNVQLYVTDNEKACVGDPKPL